MRTALRAFLAAASASAVLPLCAADGTVLGTSAASPAFAVYSVEGATYATASQAEIAALPPVFIRSGETVTVSSPSGGATPLASPSLASVLNAGGVWTLASSAQGTARVGVAWTVYGDGGVLAANSFGEIYGVDSEQPGPNRKARKRDTPPVAYSGDDWHSSLSAAASVTFISPSGETTQLDLTGTGATQFTFGKSGLWTIRLVMADGTTREAKVFILAGFSLSIR